MENVYLMVGLGNPGEEYARTRHNAGFRLVEELARRWRAGWSFEKKFNARLARANLDEKRVFLCEPHSYMNASGEVVRAVMDYFQVELGRMLVSVDDADLPVGELRLRGLGGSGGHHGLESMMEHLGSGDFARQRLGIGRTPEMGRKIASHVLGEFAPGESEEFEKVLVRAADQAECWLRSGLQKAMNQFNGVRDSGETK